MFLCPLYRATNPSSSELSTPAAASSEERKKRLEEKREKVFEELKPGLSVCLRWRRPRRKRERERE
jgi:hypothetical protein